MKRRSESQRTTDDADCAENVRTARGACLLLCIVVGNHSNNYGNRGWKPLKQWEPVGARRPRPTIHGEKLVTKSLHTRIPKKS